MRIVFLVGLGGFVGSAGRYLIQSWISRLLPVAFPYGTLLINLSGCFLIGILEGMLERNPYFPAEWRFFLATGLCGGFTTFSAFSLDAFALARDGQYGAMTLYVTTSVLLGLLATVAAVSLVRWLTV